MAGLDPQRRTLIGNPPNHWLYDGPASTFDLTRPAPPDFDIPSEDCTTRLSTTTKSVICSPSKTALVIIDMQNVFLSPYLGQAADGAGNKAAARLLDVGIPAARKAQIQIIWLNWGLTDSDVDQMPPSMQRAFGFEVRPDKEGRSKPVSARDAYGVTQTAAEQVMHTNSSNVEELTENGKSKNLYPSLGSDIGSIEIEDGKVVDGGRLLMRDTWNASLPPTLNAAYEEGLKAGTNPDVWIHKNRMSGLWGSSTPCTEYLEKRGITTLLFAGVNTDQCVGGSLQDAFSKGWDCILLKDACGTTSPGFATDSIEFNCAENWGFVSDCSSLDKGVQGMLDAR